MLADAIEAMPKHAPIMIPAICFLFFISISIQRTAEDSRPYLF